MVPLLSFPSIMPVCLGGGASARKASNPYFTNFISNSQLTKLSGKSICAATGKKENNINAEKQKVGELWMKEEEMPKHVAVIMDGNRRWAMERGFPAMYGHYAGRMAEKALIPLCIKFGIKAFTVFAFSTENWSRPNEEVVHLMEMFAYVLRSDLEEMMELNVRVFVIGERSAMSESLKASITEAEDRTKTNTGMELNIAINYSGKYDIIQACKSVASKIKDGTIIGVDNINESLFEQELVTKVGEYPCPDLLIRTSGEIRLSNFMLWQLAYTELYFTDVLFPDFGEEDFVNALIAYKKRGIHYDGL